MSGSVLDAFRLDGRVAIVTGAGRGIGASIARTFADAGASVALAARTKEQLEEVATDVRAAGAQRMDLSPITHLPRSGSGARRLGGEGGEGGVENFEGGSSVRVAVQAGVDDGGDVGR